MSPSSLAEAASQARVRKILLSVPLQGLKKQGREEPRALLEPGKVVAGLRLVFTATQLSSA